MRAVVQRTLYSSVTIEGQVTAEIGPGLTILLGIKKGDQEKDADYLMDKIINLRIFADEAGRMNRSLLDVQGEIMLISQFTLYGDVKHGRRPGFTDAEDPDAAEPLFQYCIKNIKKRGVSIKTGVFGAHMKITIENDGPCTILLDSEKQI
ncbi:MAG TPA: D-aminoacyl-tRNA deacylase [Syntrophomonadaceae bacterium]|jgi:D-tyrosyl-tRNA(Tyr) deacylase|nr:D-aminoacyl-tRNA deacylase [Syntrophomonadaceae bacterium]HRX20768.1 D-aminoacyl-tRNA deacylase [Syntrophomonadaceae bacterium]